MHSKATPTPATMATVNTARRKCCRERGGNAGDAAGAAVGTTACVSSVDSIYLCEMYNLLPFPSPNQLNQNRKRADLWLQSIPKSLHFIVNVQNLVFHIETAIFE